MAGQRREHLAVDGLERLPVHEPRYAFRAERSHLHELVPVDPVPEPAFARKPATAAEHQRARLTPRDRPTVDRVVLDEGRRLLQGPRLADEAAEQRASPPRRTEAVPVVT